MTEHYVMLLGVICRIAASLVESCSYSNHIAVVRSAGLSTSSEWLHNQVDSDENLAARRIALDLRSHVHESHILFDCIEELEHKEQ